MTDNIGTIQVGKTHEIGTVRVGEVHLIGTVRVGEVQELGTVVMPVAPPDPDGPESMLDFYWSAKDITLTDGDPVSAWSDRNAGASLAQTTPSKRPEFKADAKSTGQPGVVGDGVDDILACHDAGPVGVWGGKTPSTQAALVTLVISGSGVNATFPMGASSESGEAVYLRVRSLGGTSYRLRILSDGASFAQWDVSAPSGIHAITIASDGAGDIKSWVNAAAQTDQSAPTHNLGYENVTVAALKRTSESGSSVQGIHALALADSAKASAILSDFSAYYDLLKDEWGLP